MAPVKLVQLHGPSLKRSKKNNEIAVENARAAGVPDWREPAEYDLSGLSRLQLVWECLRRSPEYRSAWRRGGVDCYGFQLQSLIDPATRPSEATLRATLRNNLELPKWRLSEDLAPFMPAGQYEQRDAQFVVDALRDVQNDEEQAVLVFDLLKPLRAQLADARQLLDKRRVALDRKRSSPASRPPARKPQSGGRSSQHTEPETGPPSIGLRTRALGNLDESLRVVDGRNAGASFPKIGRVLYAKIDPDHATARARRRFEAIAEFWQERNPWR